VLRTTLLFSFKTQSPSKGKILPLQKDVGSLEINDLNFRYREDSPLVLKDINLTIKHGEKIAIVGENGAGKTTLVKLILKMYEVGEGVIKVGGVDINKISNSSLYRNISVLFQNFNTYGHLSVKQNVIVGDISKKANDKEVIKALEMADAMSFVKEYKNGVDQILSEKFTDGIRPSTGQWQKIALARFFYRDSDIVIFDEPTASIDPVSEYKIFNRIYKHIKNKTVIIISHRFSTVRQADRIIVLSKGRIVEDGSHEELMKNDSLYAKTYRLQAKAYE